MKAKIHVTLKNGVLDPQGSAITSTLGHMGFADVTGVRVGKYIEVDIAGNDKDTARERLTQMCDSLLANTVVEKYHIELVE